MTSDAQFDAALDRFAVPAPSADLAARIAEAATKRTASLPPLAAPRRSGRAGGRGLWVRTRRAVIGVAAFSVMSATAAASGLFGDRVRIPVISEIVEQVAPAPAPVASRPTKHASTAPSASAKAEATVAPPPLPAREEIAGTQEARRMVFAHRVADRMEERLSAIDAQRASKGLPPRTEGRRALLEQLKAAKTDEERRIALLAIKADNERLRQKLAARKGIDPERMQPHRRERARILSEEERKSLRDRMLTEEERRTMRARISEELPPNATREEWRELRRRLRREMVVGRPAPAPGTLDAEGEPPTVEGR